MSNNVIELVENTKKLSNEDIQIRKEEFHSRINEKTKTGLAGSFDLLAHKERGEGTNLHTRKNWTGNIYKSMILKNIDTYRLGWVNKNEKPTLIDIGCGDGIFVNQMLNSEKFEMVYGLDPFTKSKAERIIKPNFIHSWSHEIPLEDNSVDIVTTCEVLEHVPEPYVSKTFEEFKRVCNWRVYGQVSTRLGGEKYKDGVHAHICFAPAEWWINEMLKAGFKILSASQNTQGLRFILEV